MDPRTAALWLGRRSRVRRHVVPGRCGRTVAIRPARGQHPPPAWLIGAAGASLISAAVFATDPVSGYPPGTPAVPSRPTRTGMAHILSGAGFGQSPRLVTVAGLLQRISIITGFTWMTTLAAQALRRPAVASAGPRPAGPRRWTRQC
jgi:hypothetical protein